MKKSGGSGSGSRTRRCLTANFLETRLQFPVASSPANQPSPKSPIFNASSRRKRPAVAAGGGASASVAAALMESPKSNALASIPDLKHLASSRLRDLKLHVDRSHCEILKDFDSSQSRLHKRFKVSLSLILILCCRTFALFSLGVGGLVSVWLLRKYLREQKFEFSPNNNIMLI